MRRGSGQSETAHEILVENRFLGAKHREMPTSLKILVESRERTICLNSFGFFHLGSLCISVTRSHTRPEKRCEGTCFSQLVSLSPPKRLCSLPAPWRAGVRASFPQADAHQVDACARVRASGRFCHLFAYSTMTACPCLSVHNRKDTLFS